MQSLKSLLPHKSFTGTNLYGTWFEPQEIVALILRRLKEEADQVVGQEVKRVVLGRPVLFSENAEKDELAQKRLAEAGRARRQDDRLAPTPVPSSRTTKVIASHSAVRVERILSPPPIGGLLPCASKTTAH